MGERKYGVIGYGEDYFVGRPDGRQQLSQSSEFEECEEGIGWYIPDKRFRRRTQV